MRDPDLDILERAKRFAALFDISVNLETPLGHGTDGHVWETSRKTALKVFRRERNYRREVECYERLGAANVTKIDDFAVPTLIAHDDTLMVIEITIVSPPCIIDFGKASLDEPFDYPSEMAAEDESCVAEMFGDNWAQVQSILAQLQAFYGIYYLDPRPWNIMFPGWDEEE